MSNLQPEANFDLNFNFEDLDEPTDEELFHAAMAFEQVSSASVPPEREVSGATGAIGRDNAGGTPRPRFPQLSSETVEQLAAKK